MLLKPTPGAHQGRDTMGTALPAPWSCLARRNCQERMLLGRSTPPAWEPWDTGILESISVHSITCSATVPPHTQVWGHAAPSPVLLGMQELSGGMLNPSLSLGYPKIFQNLKKTPVKRG